MTKAELKARAENHLAESVQVIQASARSCLDATVQAAEMMAASLKAGGKVMLCGNGGSAADAQHIAAEFTNRLTSDRERPPLASLALTTDTSFLTSHANDYQFNTVFSRQLEALGKRGDVLVAISTSGKSANVIEAVRVCPKLGIQTIGLLGGDGGPLGKLVDLAIVPPHKHTGHIQEAHIALAHAFCDLTECLLFD